MHTREFAGSASALRFESAVHRIPQPHRIDPLTLGGLVRELIGGLSSNQGLPGDFNIFAPNSIDIWVMLRLSPYWDPVALHDKTSVEHSHSLPYYGVSA